MKKYLFNFLFLSVITLAFLSLRSTPVEAQQFIPIPIHPQAQGIPISTLPFTIDRCGKYFLTKCLKGISGMDGITIAASDVTIDLNGNTLYGVPGSFNGIRAEPGTKNIAIQDGTVRDWDENGMFFGNDIEKIIFLEKVKVINNTLSGVVGQNGGTTTIIIKDCIAFGNGDNGFDVEAGIITGSFASHNVNVGFKANSFSFIGNKAATNGINYDVQGTKDHNHPIVP